MKALIVDDDRVLADVVAFTLRREGFDIVFSYDGESALQQWARETPDIIVLDVNMPKLDGFQVCKKIRQESDVPIILLTVRGEEDDIVEGLKIGADDYIVKPFSPRQLIARVNAVLRRAGHRTDLSVRQIGELTYEGSRREVTIDNQTPITLAPLEDRLFQYLLINAGHVMTKEIIIGHVWGPMGGDHDMLRQMIHRLRSKIERDSSNPKYLITVPGLGYGLMIDSDKT